MSAARLTQTTRGAEITAGLATDFGPLENPIGDRMRDVDIYGRRFGHTDRSDLVRG